MTPFALSDEALRRSEERFLLLVEGLKEYAFYMLDPDGRVASWNVGAQRIKGYAPDEIIGRSFSVFFTPNDILRRAPEAELRIAAERGVYEDEAWRVRKDGSEFWASVMLTAVRDAAGDLIGFAKLTRDFTERRQARDALRASEERFTLFTSAVKDYALFTLDRHGRVESWNPGAARINGYSANEIIGHHFSRFYTIEDIARGKPDRELVIAAETGRYEEEGRRVRKDGSEFWAHVVISPLIDEAGRLHGYAKVTQDITERKQAEDEARELNRALERHVAERTAQLDATVRRLEGLVEEKNVLIREVHHRVKNNLQIVTSLLNLKAQTLPPEAREHFAEAAARIRAIARVHDRLSGVDNVAAIDARSLVEGLCRDVSDSYGIEQRIAFDIDAAPVTFDLETATPVGMLVAELLSNAVKHAFPAGRSGVVRITMRQEGGWNEVTVHDNGAGLPADYAGRRSLGSAIMASLVQQLHGSLDIRSDGGTVATVRWPVAQRAEPPAP